MELQNVPLTPEETARILMRGICYDIANSHKIPNDEKKSLINAIENWLLRDGTFSTRQRSLLYRIRNEYHIRNSGLYSQAEPESFLDIIRY